MSKILKYSLSVLIFSAFALSANAQNDESFLDFYRQRAQEFKDWRSKANSEFTDYLAAAWEEFLVQRGKEDPVGPVPDEPVYYDPSEAESSGLPGLPCPGFMTVPAVVSVPAVSASYAELRKYLWTFSVSAAIYLSPII